LYDQLSSKADIILRKDIEKSVEPIENISNSLELIMYPETNEVKNMITFANELEKIRSEIIETDKNYVPTNERTLEKEVITIEREVTIKSP
jgi:hypothetical protein